MKFFSLISLKMRCFCRNIFAKHQDKIVMQVTKNLKMPIVKGLKDFIIIELTRKLFYISETENFKIVTGSMTDTIIPGHIRLLEINTISGTDITYTYTVIPWRRKWQPTPVFLPGESHGGRSLVGYSPWGRKESDVTERLHFHTVMALTMLNITS